VGHGGSPDQKLSELQFEGFFANFHNLHTINKTVLTDYEDTTQLFTRHRGPSGLIDTSIAIYFFIL
jgi:hypothetical protein